MQLINYHVLRLVSPYSIEHTVYIEVTPYMNKPENGFGSSKSKLFYGLSV